MNTSEAIAPTVEPDSLGLDSDEVVFSEDAVDATGTSAWASFLGINAEHVSVSASLGSLDIHVMPITGHTCVEDAVYALHRLLEVTPPRWNWSLDLAAVKTFDLRFMDSLLTIGRELDLRGGALTIKEFRIPDMFGVFSELFKCRCDEYHITWVKPDDCRPASN